jgi:hypothetical protein
MLGLPWASEGTQLELQQNKFSWLYVEIPQFAINCICLLGKWCEFAIKSKSFPVVIMMLTKSLCFKFFF